MPQLMILHREIFTKTHQLIIIIIKYQEKTISPKLTKVKKDNFSLDNNFTSTRSQWMFHHGNRCALCCAVGAEGDPQHCRFINPSFLQLLSTNHGQSVFFFFFLPPVSLSHTNLPDQSQQPTAATHIFKRLSLSLSLSSGHWCCRLCKWNTILLVGAAVTVEWNVKAADQTTWSD